MSENAPQTVYRKDYTAPDFWIDRVDLCCLYYCLDSKRKQYYRIVHLK